MAETEFRVINERSVGLMPTVLDQGRDCFGMVPGLAESQFSTKKSFFRVTPKNVWLLAISSAAFQNADSPAEMSSCHPISAQALGMLAPSDDQQ